MTKIQEVAGANSDKEQRFIDRHVIQKRADRNGNGDDVFNASDDDKDDLDEEGLRKAREATTKPLRKTIFRQNWESYTKKAKGAALAEVTDTPKVDVAKNKVVEDLNEPSDIEEYDAYSYIAMFAEELSESHLELLFDLYDSLSEELQDEMIHNLTEDNIPDLLDFAITHKVS